MAAGTANVARVVTRWKTTRAPLTYVIASTPRTGSYLLCEGLAGTGLAGLPTEPFCPEYKYEYCQRWHLSPDTGFDRFLATVLEQGTTPNGVFGVKVHWMQVDQLAHETAHDRRGQNPMSYLFPNAKYIHLTRRDLRAQAISYYRAVATREWWRIEGVQNHQVSGPEPAFDSKEIRSYEVALSRQDEAWRDFLHLHRLPTLLMEYESLYTNYRSEIGRALSFLGLNAAAAEKIPPPRLARQADETTELWRARLDDEDRRLS